MSLLQALPPRGYHFRDVQLEMSLKPFWDNSPETMRAVCREVALQWLPLCRHAGTVSVQLWIGDGSEILEYAGDPDAEFEWARYHGAANPIAWHGSPDARDSGDPDHDAIGAEARVRDPERRGVHQKSYLYRPEPAVFTYRWLSGLVRTLKEICGEILGRKILVGTTFDIGPEFAISRFKYEWHPEICGGGSLFGGKFIRCDAVLAGDKRVYAAFPSGIPEGTSIGTFLGRQCERFFSECAFDFLWLSNGFGFGLEPWALTGAIFDGREFRKDRAVGTADLILQFWRDFRNENPMLPIRTRGTNLTTGVDLGSDASPLREIYQSVAHVEPPVNSPWAALDGDIGLELAGWMSHIARTPGHGYRFRYYIHDPWWMNSPWLDRYQRQPFDIYLPLAVSRLTAQGEIEPPSDIAFLSIDDSHGAMPPSVPTEVIAHILHAREFLPDAPALLIWAYPFDEYHDLTKESAPDLPFFGDWFIRGLIARGLPINTVCCLDELWSLMEKDPQAVADSVLIAPVIPGPSAKRLLEYAARGGRVVVYGPLDQSPALRAALSLDLAEPLDGDFSLGNDGRRIRHLDFLSAGGWREVAVGEGDFIRVRQDGSERVAAACVTWPTGGQLGWVRGSLATAEYDVESGAPIKGPRLKEMDPQCFVGSEEMVRALLDKMQVKLRIDATVPAVSLPLLTIHRHANAFVFSGRQPDASVALKMALPSGAPLFPATVNVIQAGMTVHAGPPAWHHVCRAFLETEGDAKVTCRILPPVQHGYTSRLLISGAAGSTIRFYPEPGTHERLEILRNPKFPYFQGDFADPIFENRAGECVLVRDVADEVLFSW